MNNSAAEKTRIIPSRFAIGVEDFIFGFTAICVLLLFGSQGLIDDPGLGWHLRIADAMWEHGGFVYSEQFCYPSEGQPWVTKAWLSDIIFRFSYGWGGLNGVAVLAALIFALTARGLYVRMAKEGVSWIPAVFVTYLAILGMSPSATARSNLFTMLGLMYVCRICEQYHDGQLSRKKTLWLLPLFVLWPNLHGGYIAGIIVLVVTYVIECSISVGALDRTKRTMAWGRVRWLTVLGIGILLATLCNPNFWHLHLWNIKMLTDPYLQTQTTVEWLPPDFTASGWFRIEFLILLLPCLLATSRYRPSLVSLGLIVVWLHFGLTSARYSPLWVIVAAPTTANLLVNIPYVQWVAERFVRLWSDDIRLWIKGAQVGVRWKASLFIAVAMMSVSPWLGNVARHSPDHAKTQVGLDQLLSIYQGEKVFHSVNWGGYLTLQGWNLQPRLKTFIDDRIDVHGQALTQEYFGIMNASTDWESSLEKHGVELLCLPREAPLASDVEQNENWSKLYGDDCVVIYRLRDSGGGVDSRARLDHRRLDTDK